MRTPGFAYVLCAFAILCVGTGAFVERGHLTTALELGNVFVALFWLTRLYWMVSK